MSNPDFKNRLKAILKAHEGVPKDVYDRGFKDALALFEATYTAYHPENMPKLDPKKIRITDAIPRHPSLS